MIIQYFHPSLAIQITVAIPVQDTATVGQVWKHPYDRSPIQAFKNCIFLSFLQKQETCHRTVLKYTWLFLSEIVFRQIGSRARSMNLSRPAGPFLCFELLQQ